MLIFHTETTETDECDPPSSNATCDDSSGGINGNDGKLYCIIILIRNNLVF